MQANATDVLGTAPIPIDLTRKELEYRKDYKPAKSKVLQHPKQSIEEYI
jgi:hypothetical protein